ncbi:MAG: response regulator [Planctomycetales bacterium]|nr:response regulator [Planctomycetales bacterium]
MQHAKILVADDSGTIRLCLKRALQSAGYEVFLACDGLEAVRVAREVDIDLAILDIQMPEMDGYTACEQILRDGVLPIIFLTRDVAPHLSTLGDQLGAYLPKPADDKTLLKTVRNLLQRVVTQAC